MPRWRLGYSPGAAKVSDAYSEQPHPSEPLAKCNHGASERSGASVFPHYTLSQTSGQRSGRQKDRPMILKVAQPSHPYGWDYFDGIEHLVTSGRREFPATVRAENVLKAFAPDSGIDAWLDWRFTSLYWVTPIAGERQTTLSLIAFQWTQPTDKVHVLVTSETVYLMSDDGKTIDRL